jgi:SsrA-binding protein
MYFKAALVKVEIALCTGKKLYDKREDLKRKTELLEARKAHKYRQ